MCVHIPEVTVQPVCGLEVLNRKRSQMLLGCVLLNPCLVLPSPFMGLLYIETTILALFEDKKKKLVAGKSVSFSVFSPPDETTKAKKKGISFLGTFPNVERASQTDMLKRSD